MKSEELLRKIQNEDLAGTITKDRHRVAFLAMRDAIRTALDGGATAKRIWKTLQRDRKMDCSYQTFSRYVNRLIVEIDSPPKPILAESVKPQKSTTGKPQIATKKPPETPKQADPPKSELKGFHYNPTSLTMDDLLSTDEG